MKGRQRSGGGGRKARGRTRSPGRAPGRRSRVSKDEYYLNIAAEVATRSTCMRRNFGAVIVKADQIISTGYNGAPRGTMNCIDMGICYREALGVGRGERYELCRAIHAELNAIIHAPRFEMMDGTMFVVGLDPRTGRPVDDAECCRMCKRAIINSGLARVVIRKSGGAMVEYRVRDWMKKNLGELERRGGKLVPRRVRGY